MDILLLAGAVMVLEWQLGSSCVVEKPGFRMP